MYTIRQFSERRECATVDTLRETLASDYRGQSVAVQFETPRGMKQSVFVDVDDAGEIAESHGRQAPVDFDALEYRRTT